jgi:hypothetical protein
VPQRSWDRFIMLQDVNWMSWVIKQKTIQLYAEDVISIRLWVNKLKSNNVNVFYKNKLGQPPSSSGM